MSSHDRVLNIIELLVDHANGLPLSDIADRLRIPRSAAHRLLADLRDAGYVRQSHEGGFYRLTVKLIALSLALSNSSGITNILRPLLDDLAASTGEMVMMTTWADGKLIRVAKAQGARTGLLYNPTETAEVHLASTSNGHALLSCFDDDLALELAAKQGLQWKEYGPKAPQSLMELLDYVRAARNLGHAVVHEVYQEGISAVAVPIFQSGTRTPIGTASIAGPVQRFTEERIQQFIPLMKQMAHSISLAAPLTNVFVPSGGTA